VKCQKNSEYLAILLDWRVGGSNGCASFSPVPAPQRAEGLAMAASLPRHSRRHDSPFVYPPGEHLDGA
jgi:hypothetical protein